MASSQAAEQEKVVFILRGISGSGKSTLAKAILTKYGLENTAEPWKYIFSSDDYFVNRETKKYEFDGAKIGSAHNWNQKRATKAMQSGQTPIIIDNTNTQLWEMKPYVEEALANNYKVEVQEPTTPWAKNAEELAKRNVHSVPLEAVQRMLTRWETFEKLEDITNAQVPKRMQKKPSSGSGHRGGRGGHSQQQS